MRQMTITAAVLLCGVVLGIIVSQLFDGTATAEQSTEATHSVSKNDPQHPVDPALDWCAGHRVPETECTRCHAELIEDFKSRGDWCGEHDVPESHCRRCDPTLTFPQEPAEPVTAEPIQASVFFPPNNEGCPSDQAVIRFATAETATRVGLAVEPVVTVASAVAVEAPAELVFDQTRTAAVTLSIPATVVRWLIEPGQKVGADDPLVELESPDMAQLKSDYLEAEADWVLDERQLRRARELEGKGLISRLEFEDTEAHEMAARSRRDGLRSRSRALGLTPGALDTLVADSEVGARWVLCAGQAATVLERRAPLGERLDAGATLALLGDPSALWIEAHVREQDLGRFGIGQTVEFTADGDQLTRTRGQVIWISQYLDPQARTGLVRARLTETSEELRANRFGRVRLPEKADTAVLFVPKDAVQWDGCCNLVFVQEAVDRYRPHKVAIGRGDSRHYAVLSGVAPGDLVVTTGSFLLKTELQKESLGAGCAGE